MVSTETPGFLFAMALMSDGPNMMMPAISPTIEWVACDVNLDSEVGATVPIPSDLALLITLVESERCMIAPFLPLRARHVPIRRFASSQGLGYFGDPDDTFPKTKFDVNMRGDLGECKHVILLFRVFTGRSAAGVFVTPDGSIGERCLVIASGPFQFDEHMKGDMLCVIGVQPQVMQGVPVVMLPMPDTLHAVIRLWNEHSKCSVVELFAGLGGWSFGFKLYQQAKAKGARLIAIDTNRDVLLTFQKNHGGTFWEFSDVKSFTDCLQQDDPILIHSDFQDKKWWSILFWIPCVALWFSSPCQPWSQAANALGLDSWDGETILDVAQFISITQPHHALGENVAGLLCHKDWNEVKDAFMQTGLYGPFCTVVDLAAVTACVRKRCIIILMRDCPQVHGAFNGWNQIGVMDSPSNRFLAEECGDLDRCRIDPVALEMMLDPTYAPPSVKARFGSDVMKSALRDLRFINGDETVPTFMHQYSRQHQLGKDLLRRKGLMSFGIDSIQGARYFHPCEIARLLGFPVGMILPFAIEQAYRQLGNSISPVHAIFAFHVVEVASGYFGLSHEQIIKRLCLPLFTMSTQRVDHDDKWMWLQPQRLIEPQVHTIVFHVDDFMVIPWTCNSETTLKEALHLAMAHSLHSAIKSVYIDDFLEGKLCSLDDVVVSAHYSVHLSNVNIVVEPVGICSIHPLLKIYHLVMWVQHTTSMPVECFCLSVNRTIPEAETMLYLFQSQVVRVLQAPLKGGARDDVKTWLAGILTQKGVPDGRLPERVMFVVDKIGWAQAKECMTAKDPWIALKDKANEYGITLLRPEERSHNRADLEPTPDWWAKSANKSRDKKGRGKGKNADFNISKVQIDFSFFRCADDSVPPALKIEDFGPDVTGLVVVNHDDSQLPSVLAQIRGQKFSPDELAILVLGTASLGSEVDAQQVTIPGWVRGQPAALQGLLVQCGDTPLQTASSQKISLTDVPQSTVIMVNVYRNGNDQWTQLDQGAERFLKKLSSGEIKQTLEVWSFAYFRGGKKVAFQDRGDAEYAHFVFRCPDNFLAKMLRLSGTNGTFMISKGPEGGRDVRYRILQTDCVDMHEMQHYLLQIPEHQGVVKVNGFLGLRVEKSKYKDAKKKIYPEASTDEDYHGQPDAVKYTIMNLPPGCDKLQLRRALKEASWPAQVLTPNVHRTWTVLACASPPARVLQIQDTNAVILKQIPHGERTIVAATDRRLVTRPMNFDIEKGSGCSQSERSVTGPQKLRFEQLMQDVKADLKHDLKHDLAKEIHDATSKLNTQQEVALVKCSQLEEQLTNGLAACNTRISEQGVVLQDLKRDHARAVQQFTQGMQTLEHTVKAQSQSMSSQLDSFFARAEAFHQNQAVKVQDKFDQRFEEKFDELRALFGEKRQKGADGARVDHSGNLVFLWECIPAAFFQHACAFVESLQRSEVVCGFLMFCACLMYCFRFHSIQILINTQPIRCHSKWTHACKAPADVDVAW